VHIHYILFDLKTGRPRQFGTAQEDAIAGLGGKDQAVIVSDTPLKKTIELTGKHYGTADVLDIDAVRATLKRSIDSKAFAAIGTVLPSYAAKEVEARAFAAGTLPIEQTAYIKAQADLTGQKPADIAAAIIQAADDHAREMPKFEAWRTSLKWMIDGEDNLAKLFAIANTPLP
jgi:hypothetical protein